MSMLSEKDFAALKDIDNHAKKYHEGNYYIVRTELGWVVEVGYNGTMEGGKTAQSEKLYKAIEAVLILDRLTRKIKPKETPDEPGRLLEMQSYLQRKGGNRK